MNADEHRRPDLDDPRVIEALDEYLAALEAGHRPDRGEFLARHPDVAPALADCLDGMEALHEASSSSPQPVAWKTPETCQPGTPLGDFRILREVGRGGMGVVYEAEQLSLGRRIALKVLPFALTLDPKQLQRFKNEARAAAQLHLQHIVPVYFVGTERGVHFYAMQFIEGQSLAEVIEGLRHLARSGKAGASVAGGLARPATAHDEPSGPAVSPAAETAAEPVGALATAYSTSSARFYRAVARVGVQAAEALEHAHEYGVVHRDVKPANLLVDAHGHLWVTDFGLAQFHADAGLTQTGDLLGTLRYMSPEQAGGQRVLLDHRTDVYSLGATLYELLTLRPPFDGADRQTLLHQILHEEPRPPRALEKSITLELETIVLKALAKAPAERYATAKEFGDDLKRFLDHQPIRARRATVAQRARKWARRHPSWVVAFVVLCVLTAAGSLVSAELIWREQAKTQKRAEEAEARFQLARAAVDEVLQLCEQELANRPDLDNVRRQLLVDALEYYHKLIEQRGDDPTAKADLDATRARAEKVLAELTVLQGAGKYHLLDEPAVRDDLRLNDEQRAKVAELADRLHRRGKELFREFHRLSGEERQQGFLNLARASEAEVGAVLKPHQQQRLRQIYLQAQGPRAFEDPDVVSALKLTAGQKARIRSITADAIFGGPDFPPCEPGPGKPPETHENPFAAAVAKIEATLNEDQAREWKKLTGERFQGHLRMHFGPPGPFGPPPGEHHPRRGEGPPGLPPDHDG
jgi:serine/threonine protein kinase